MRKVTEQRDIFMPVLFREADAGKETGPQIVGHAAVFDVPTQIGGRIFGFTETIARGAFAETIEEDDVRAVVNHEPTLILGRNKAETLKLSEDDVGLRMEIDVPDTSVGRDIVVSVERGDVSGASFMFQVLEEEWKVAGDDDDFDHRTIKKVKLFDVGPVTFPAYDTTDVSVNSIRGLKEVVEARQERAAASLELARRQRKMFLDLADHDRNVASL